MHSTHRSSKGKGRADDGGGDEDYAPSLASLSLSDCVDPLTPRTDSYGPPYTDEYLPYEQPCTGDGQYTWTAYSSLPPMQSSPAPYAGTTGYNNSFSTVPAASPMGGYGYQSGPPSTPDYGGYTGYSTASVTSSSYGGGSVSGWSDSQSRGTTASSAPSARSHRTDVNSTINRQRPTNERFQLPCEFRNLTGCDRVFPGDDERGWMDHVEGHLHGNFPTKLLCCKQPRFFRWKEARPEAVVANMGLKGFCNDTNFDAKVTSEGDARSNFNMRMQHIRYHLVYEGYRPEQMQKDGHLVKHLFDQNLIDRRTYENILNPTTVPRVPGSKDRKHRHLPRVEEEVVAESSSSHRHRRRDHGPSSHKHKH